jgi:hypothetical protein
MKPLTVLIAIIIACSIISSCRTQKPDGQKIVQQPCKDKMDNTKTVLRAFEIGESLDEGQSIINARTQDIQTRLKNGIGKYSRDDKYGNTEYSFERKMQDIDVLTSIFWLPLTSTTCQETHITNEKVYKTYVTIEVSKEEVLKALEQNVIGFAHKKKIDIDERKFKEDMKQEFDAHLQETQKTLSDDSANK